MTLSQLNYFCTAVQYNSITKAAEKLFVSQPAVSGAIKELEKEFSIKLFSRNRNKLALTDEGLRFYERAEALLRDVETAKHQLHDLGTAQTKLSVGIPPLWGSAFFPDLLHDFSSKYPNIRLTFYEYGSAKASALVQEKELDVALVNMSHVAPERLHSVCIGKDCFVIAVDPSHPMARRSSISLEELADVPLVMYNTDSVQNYSVTSRFEKLGITPNIVIYTSQIYTMKSMIHNNTCVSFFYASLLQDHPDLVGIPLEPPIEQKVGLIWRKQRYTPSSTEAFISFATEYPLFPEVL
ncbi:MAG: LysR family transcriptional regulator [Eubacteriales bacterium]|nr:LysR family transcriptional regulator [Eubacteriales bacterium]